jgi:hypothetical protein
MTHFCVGSWSVACAGRLAMYTTRGIYLAQSVCDGYQGRKISRIRTSSAPCTSLSPQRLSGLLVSVIVYVLLGADVQSVTAQSHYKPETLSPASLPRQPVAGGTSSATASAEGSSQGSLRPRSDAEAQRPSSSATASAEGAQRPSPSTPGGGRDVAPQLAMYARLPTSLPPPPRRSTFSSKHSPHHPPQSALSIPALLFFPRLETTRSCPS